MPASSLHRRRTGEHPHRRAHAPERGGAAPAPGSVEGARRFIAGTRNPAIVITVAGVALLLVLGEIIADIVPDTPLLLVLTPLRLVIGAGLVAVVVDLLRNRRGRRIDLPPVSVVLAMTAVAATTAVVTLVTGNGAAQWRALLTAMAAGALAWGIARSGVEAARLLPLGALLGLVATSLVGVGQTVNRVPTGFCRGSILGDADTCGPGAMVRADGTFANPNLLAAAILILLPLGLTACAAITDKAGRLAGYTGCVLGVVALFMTGSRGGVAAALAGIVVFLVARRPTRVRLLALVAVAIVVVAAGVVYILLGGAAGPRGTAWRTSAQLVAENPMGLGLGASAGALVELTPGSVAFEHAHNLWVAWFIDAGVLGGLAVLSLTAVIFWAVTQVVLRGAPQAPYAATALAAFATISLLDHPANAERLALLLALASGHAIGLLHLSPRGEAGIAPGDRTETLPTR